MRDFIFYNPTRIVFGRGKTSEIGELTAAYGSRILLVHGRESARKTGLLTKVIRSLAEAEVDVVESGGVKSNPVLSFARKAISLFRKTNREVVVAVGGGSVIDTAKTVAAGACYDGDAWDFYCGKAQVQKAVPVLAVLTLAATASEMNDGAVMTNEETGQKFSCGGDALFPKVSILDPENTFTVPLNYSMYGAVDAIVHLLESYFNATDPDTPLQDRFVEGLVQTIKESAEIIFREPHHYQARANLMWAATLGLNGLAPAGVGGEGYPMHMIEHALSALYDVPHGAGLGIVAPAWMRYQCYSAPQKIAQFGERIFGFRVGSPEEKAKKGIRALEIWLQSIGVPIRLQDIGIPLDDIAKIAANAEMNARRWKMEKYRIELIKAILSLATIPRC